MPPLSTPLLYAAADATLMLRRYFHDADAANAMLIFFRRERERVI